MVRHLTERKEWKFFGVLPKADRVLAIAWWVALVLRGVLPAVFAVATGVLVGAVQRGDDLSGPLALTGAVFVLLQVLTPIHQAVSAIADLTRDVSPEYFERTLTLFIDGLARERATTTAMPAPPLDDDQFTAVMSRQRR